MQTVVASNDGNIFNIYFDFVTNAFMCLDASGRRPRAVEIHLKCAFTRCRSNNRISRESDFLTTDDVFTMLIAIKIFHLCLIEYTSVLAKFYAKHTQ